jgi:hypothetical protein
MKYSLGRPIFIHFKSVFVHISGFILVVSFRLVESRGSFHDIISYRIHASSTVFVKVPGVSRLDAIAITHHLELRPYVGLNHTTQHMLAGCLMLHPVSVPSAAGTSQAATEAALHELDQPGIRVTSQGFLVILKAEFSQLQPIANSSRFSFHILDIQASFNFFITVAS